MDLHITKALLRKHGIRPNKRLGQHFLVNPLAAEEIIEAAQVGSEIAFPDVRLRFSNDLAVFESEIERHFPDQSDGFQRLLAAIVDYDRLDRESGLSAREQVARHITDPLLVEMILCPLLFYGGAREHDMDFTSSASCSARSS